MRAAVNLEPIPKMSPRPGISEIEQIRPSGREFSAPMIPYPLTARTQISEQQQSKSTFRRTHAIPSWS